MAQGHPQRSTHRDRESSVGKPTPGAERRLPPPMVGGDGPQIQASHADATAAAKAEPARAKFRVASRVRRFKSSTDSSATLVAAAIRNIQIHRSDLKITIHPDGLVRLQHGTTTTEQHAQQAKQRQPEPSILFSMSDMNELATKSPHALALFVQYFIARMAGLKAGADPPVVEFDEAIKALKRLQPFDPWWIKSAELHSAKKLVLTSITTPTAAPKACKPTQLTLFHFDENYWRLYQLVRSDAHGQLKAALEHYSVNPLDATSCIKFSQQAVGLMAYMFRSCGGNDRSGQPELEKDMENQLSKEQMATSPEIVNCLTAYSDFIRKVLSHPLLFKFLGLSVTNLAKFLNNEQHKLFYEDTSASNIEFKNRETLLACILQLMYIPYSASAEQSIIPVIGQIDSSKNLEQLQKLSAHVEGQVPGTNQDAVGAITLYDFNRIVSHVRDTLRTSNSRKDLDMASSNEYIWLGAIRDIALRVIALHLMFNDFNSDRNSAFDAALNEAIASQYSNNVITYARFWHTNTFGSVRYKVNTSRDRRMLLLDNCHTWPTDVPMYNYKPKLKGWHWNKIQPDMLKTSEFGEGDEVLSFHAFNDSNYTKFLLGPFTQVFLDSDTHDTIARDMTEVTNRLTQGKNVLLIGYGASGAGKTSTLIYTHNQHVQQVGVLDTLCKLVMGNEGGTITLEGVIELMNRGHRIVVSTPIQCTVSYFDNLGQVYTIDKAYVHTNTHVHRVAQMNYGTGASTSHEGGTTTFSKGCALSKLLLHMVDADRHVKATTNNPNSSRSHVLICISFGPKKGKLVVGDLAGVENAFDCQKEDVIQRFASVREHAKSGDRTIPYPFYSVYPINIDFNSQMMTPMSIAPFNSISQVRRAHEGNVAVDNADHAILQLKTALEQIVQTYGTYGLPAIQVWNDDRFTDAAIKLLDKIDSEKTEIKMQYNAAAAIAEKSEHGGNTWEVLKNEWEIDKATSVKLPTPYGKNAWQDWQSFKTACMNAVVNFNDLKSFLLDKNYDGRPKYPKANSVPISEYLENFKDDTAITFLQGCLRRALILVDKSQQDADLVSLSMTNLDVMVSMYSMYFIHNSKALDNGFMINNEFFKCITQKKQSVHPSIKSYAEFVVDSKTFNSLIIKKYIETNIGKPTAANNSYCRPMLPDIKDAGKKTTLITALKEYSTTLYLNYVAYSWISIIDNLSGNDPMKIDIDDLLTTKPITFPVPIEIPGNIDEVSKLILKGVKKTSIVFDILSEESPITLTLGQWIELFQSEQMLLPHAVYALQHRQKLIDMSKSMLDTGKKACIARRTEGEFINTSLGDLRREVYRLIQNVDDPPIIDVPPYNAHCHDRYFPDPWISHRRDDLQKNTGSVIHKTIKDVFKVEDFTLCIFNVFNQSIEADNPPATPYLDFNTFKYNVSANHLTDAMHNLADIVDKYRPVLSRASLTEIVVKLGKYLEHIVSITDKTLLHAAWASFMREFTNVMSKIDTYNAASSIGTLEFIDRISKFDAVRVLCDRNKYDNTTRQNGHAVFAGNPKHGSAAAVTAVAPNHAVSTVGARAIFAGNTTHAPAAAVTAVTAVTAAAPNRAVSTTVPTAGNESTSGFRKFVNDIALKFGQRFIQ